MENKKIQTGESAGREAKVLIPVDFSPKGSLAVNVGFELGRRLGLPVELIHASAVMGPVDVPQFPDDFTGLDNEESEIEEVEIDREVHDIDMRSMHRLTADIRKLQKDGKLPEIDFDTVIAPGMPEEVISEYCDASPVRVIVMATRNISTRYEELIGSVTAEVIDHCIAPVMTVPANYPFKGFRDIVRICAFCHLDEGDLKCISSLMEMFDNPEVAITLFPVSEKIKGKERTARLQALKEKVQALYPNATFTIFDMPETGNLRAISEKMFEEEKIQMILVPNRKRNALVRFFSPGLAHKILYEVDFPMLVIPVKAKNV